MDHFLYGIVVNIDPERHGLVNVQPVIQDFTRLDMI